MLTALAMASASALVAQDRGMLLSESFDGGSLPSGWGPTGSGTSCWRMSATSHAGGQPSELLLYYDPAFNGTARMVTPAVDLTGVTQLGFGFRHSLDNYAGSHTIGVATSSDNGTTWNTAWSQMYGSNGVWQVGALLNTPDLGQPNVKLCIFYTGNSYNINNWYFDDIEFFSIETLDAGVLAVNAPSFTAAGPLTVTADIRNMGATPVAHVKAQYQVGEGEPVVEDFYPTINTMDQATLTFAAPAMMLPGVQHITVTLLQVNGQADNSAGNDAATRSVSVAMDQTDRIPMIEHFSSSTCGPCVSVNNSMHNFCNTHEGLYTYTKYPMNWPGSGDPYYTAEGGTRRNYYGVNAVPAICIDGETVNAGSAASAFNQYAARPAFMDIRGAFAVDGNMVNVTADVTSFLEGNFRVFVSVNEKSTRQNAASNGETVFYHIFMKMMTPAAGTSEDFAAGDTRRFEYSYNMQATNVEEMSDLEVSIWVQDYATKTVFNSHFAYENGALYAAPQNLELVNLDDPAANIMTATWQAPAEGTPTGYNVYLNGELMLENTLETSYIFEGQTGNYYTVGVQALYADAVTSVRVIDGMLNEWGAPVIGIAAAPAARVAVYPNPANAAVRVESAAGIASVRVYNAVGALVEVIEGQGRQVVDVATAGYGNGIYILNVSQIDGAASNQRVVVAHN